MNEINQKLQILREAACYQPLGPDYNKFELNPCLSQDEVQDFENQYKVLLPDDYKQFVLELGNGGAGPYYGLATLQNSHPKHMIALPWTQEYWNNQPFDSLSKDFPYTGNREQDVIIADSFYDDNGDDKGSSDDNYIEITTATILSKAKEYCFLLSNKISLLLCSIACAEKSS